MIVKNIIVSGELKFIHIYYHEDELEGLLKKFDGYIYELHKFKRGNIISLSMSYIDDKYRNYYVLKINEKEKNPSKSRNIEQAIFNDVIISAKEKGIVRKWSNPEFKKMYCDYIEKNLISDIDDSKVDMDTNELNKLKTLKKGDIDFNKIINDEMVTHLTSKWINKLPIIDWGKHCARPNELICKDILNQLLPEGFIAHTTDDDNCPDIDTTNNSPGFDIIIQCPDGRLKRIQCKMRQVKGVTPFSTATHFETTRRNSKKNEGKNHTGHVCYSCDEFDYVLVTLVHVKGDNIHIRHEVNHWKFSLIPISELIDKDKNCCVSSISSKLLTQYQTFN